MSAKYLIFYLIILQISLLPTINNSSYITMKVNKTGNISIFGQNFRPFPDEIFINGVKQSKIQYYFIFNLTGNIIKLIWHNKLTKCNNMFYKCSNITWIDLSNFVASNVSDMHGMFQDCSNLTFLNLSNFDTSKVTNMNGMFYGCI